MAFKKIALKAPSVASTFNEKDIKLWSIGGWLDGFNVVGQPSSGTMSLPSGSFIQNGVVVVESSSQNLTILGTGTSSDPLILYAMANGSDELKSPTYAFVLRSSIPSNTAEIASNDGTNWTMLQGVSINEIINGIKKVVEHHETSVTAGESISHGNNIRISGGTSTGDSAGDAGKAYKAGTDTIDHASVVGVALSGASSGEIFKILTKGVFSYSGLSLSQGKIHFLNTDSTFVNSQPASPNVTIVLGVALSSVDIVYIPEKSQATFTSFINNLEMISGVELEWSDTDKVKILNGTLVFNGRQYVLDVDPTKEIQLIDVGAAMDNGDSDLGHGDGALDVAGTGHQSKDTKKHSTWYYTYAKPNGTTFDPVFSTAPPNGLRRSARHLGTADRTGVGTVNATNYFEVQLGVNNIFKVKIDGGAVRALTINTAGKATDSQIVDLFNTGSSKISVTSLNDTDATATWDTKPAIRAFSIGNSTSKFGVGLCAYGKFGLNSILDIQSSGNTMNALLGFIATDGTDPYIGQDWKYLGAWRNDPDSDLFDLLRTQDNWVYYLNAQVGGGPDDIDGWSDPEGDNANAKTRVFSGDLTPEDDFFLLDTSDFLPITARICRFNILTNSVQLKWYKTEDDTSSTPILADFEYHEGLRVSGAGVAKSIGLPPLQVNTFQKKFIAAEESGSDTEIDIHGYLDPR